MKTRHIITWATVAALPFLSSCSAWNTAGISVGLEHKSLSYASAKEKIANGANVKDEWAGKCFLQEACKQHRWDLVNLFVENGASCFEAPAGYKNKPFSLFEFATTRQTTGKQAEISDEERLQLIDLCLANKDTDAVAAETQAKAFVRRSTESLKKAASETLKFHKYNNDFRQSDRRSRRDRQDDEIVEKIKVAGLAKKECEAFDAAKTEAVQRVKDLAQKQLFAIAQESGRHQYRSGDLSERISTLLEAGADINAKNNADDTPLIVCLKSKSPREIFSENTLDALIQNGADVNTPGANGETPLFITVTLGMRDAFNRLKRAGAKPSAAEADKLLRHSVRKQSANFSPNGFSLLSLDELISFGANINSKWTEKDGAEDKERSLLFIACSEFQAAQADHGRALSGNDLEAWQTLLDDLKKHGATFLPDEKQEIEKIEAFFAQEREKREASLEQERAEKFFARSNAPSADEVKTFLAGKSAITLNQRTEKDISIYVQAFLFPLVNYMSAWQKAIQYAEMGIVNYDSSMKTLSEKFVELISKSIPEWTNALEAVGVPISEKDRELIDFTQHSGFSVIAALGYYPAIATLANNGFDITGISRDGENAFHYIAETQHASIDESVIITLKNAGVDINKKNKDGFSPLALAIKNSNDEEVRVLLKYGAKPDDFIPLGGAFGNVGEKSLMDFAIETCNKLINGARYGNGDATKIQNAKNEIQNAKNIVSYMADATGTKIKNVGEFD